jgi:MraZ protein
VALTGTFNRNLDNKYRLAIPRRLREDFSEKDLNHLFVAPGPNNSLALYSQEGFERLAEILSDRSPNRANNRNYLRLFYSQAEKVEFDKQGRIRIPELWDADQWNAFLETNGPEFDQMSGQAFQ